MKSLKSSAASGWLPSPRNETGTTKADSFAARWGSAGTARWTRCWHDRILMRFTLPPRITAWTGCGFWAGKHVLIEKPFALGEPAGRRSAKSKALKREAGDGGDGGAMPPKYDVIRQLLDDGALGDLHTRSRRCVRIFYSGSSHLIPSCQWTDDGSRQLSDLIQRDGRRRAWDVIARRHRQGHQWANFDAV